MPQGHPGSEQAVIKGPGDVLRVAEHQGRLPGGGDEESILHVEEVAGEHLAGFRNSRLQDRGCVCLHCTAPSLSRSSGTRYWRVDRVNRA